MATSLPTSQQMDYRDLAIIVQDIDILGTSTAVTTAVDFDAGSSGTAGTLDIFPSTASKGKLTFKAADSAGDTATTITNASQSGARTYTIPDAGASASFVMTAGPSTFTTMPRIPTATVAAAGSDQAGATAVTTGFTLVTASDDAKGVRLPTAVAGNVCIIANGVSNKDLKVYPGTSDAINAITADSPYTMADATTAFFVAYDATTWYTIPLVAS